MNDYRITDSMGDITVTAIDEKDARRNFKNFRKCGDKDILAVELIRENVPPTKAQEREALEKIRAIVETLGPRSYVGTALEGCLQDAEINIENDFVDSMKARWESAAVELKQEMAEHKATKEELARTRQALQEAESNVEYLGRKVEEAQAKAISADLWNIIYHMVKDRFNAMTAGMIKSADLMAGNADKPTTGAFATAVSAYKQYREAKQEAEKLMGRLEGIAPEGAEF